MGAWCNEHGFINQAWQQVFTDLNIQNGPNHRFFAEGSFPPGSAGLLHRHPLPGYHPRLRHVERPGEQRCDPRGDGLRHRMVASGIFHTPPGWIGLNSLRICQNFDKGSSKV